MAGTYFPNGALSQAPFLSDTLIAAAAGGTQEFASSSDWNHDNPREAEAAVGVCLLLIVTVGGAMTLSLLGQSDREIWSMPPWAPVHLPAHPESNKPQTPSFPTIVSTGDEQQKAETMGVGNHLWQKQK